MKQDEFFIGQTVWWERRYALPPRRAAVVMLLPDDSTDGCVGVAVARYARREWFPYWAGPRHLSPRSITTETIPAFFAAVAAWAYTKAARHYAHLAQVANSPMPAGSQAWAAQVRSSLAAMEREVGEMGLIFRRDDAGHVRLLPMTDCECDAFIAASAPSESEVAR